MRLVPKQADEAQGRLDIFEAFYIDIPLRDQRDMMERPFFSLSKKPRTVPIHYDTDGVMVRVTPMERFGIATIWDADILIWAASQLTEAINRGETPSREIKFHPHALLTAIRRGVGGDHYARLQDALRRLASTYVQTNIRATGRKKIAEFHWIEAWEAVEENGKPVAMSLTLSKWVYTSIVTTGGVLAIHRDYFALTGGIDRWLYRVARKHAGHQEEGWSFTMRQLYEKSGSHGPRRNFAIDVREAVRENALPEYTLSLSRNRAGDEVVHMAPRVLIG